MSSDRGHDRSRVRRDRLLHPRYVAAPPTARSRPPACSTPAPGSACPASSSPTRPPPSRSAGRGGVPAGATGVTGNLTVTGSSAGWAVYLGPAPVASPTSSTINFTKGQVLANGADRRPRYRRGSECHLHVNGRGHDRSRVRRDRLLHPVAGRRQGRRTAAGDMPAGRLPRPRSTAHNRYSTHQTPPQSSNMVTWSWDQGAIVRYRPNVTG